MAALEAEVDAELQAALIAQCQYLLRLDDSGQWREEGPAAGDSVGPAAHTSNPALTVSMTPPQRSTLHCADPAALACCRRPEEFTCRPEPLAAKHADLGLPRQPRSAARGQKRSVMSTPSAAAVAAVAEADAVTVMVLAHSIKRARTAGGGCPTAAKAWQTPRTQVGSNRGAPHGRPASLGIRAVARDLAFTPAAAAGGEAS